MNIICASCKSQFKIADNMTALSKATPFPCPKCRTPIPLGTKPAGPGDNGFLNGADPNTYNPADRPFDFIEEEGKTALVCEHQPQLRNPIVQSLERMDYQITVEDGAREALKRMRYHTYDVVVVDEDFGTDIPDANSVLIYLERLGMAIRRNMFVVMISSRHRTMDEMTALLKSVNLIINSKNIEDFSKIIGRGLTDHLAFYRVYREKLKETGRA